MFLAVVIMWKNRKSVNYLHTLSNIYFFSKLANAALFFRCSPLYGIAYSIAVISIYVMVPEPIILESRKVRYFIGDELRVSLMGNFN